MGYLAVEATARWLMGASVLSGQPRGTWRPPGGISLPPVSGSAGGWRPSRKELETPRSLGGWVSKGPNDEPKNKNKIKNKKNEEEKAEEVARRSVGAELAQDTGNTRKVASPKRGSSASHQARGANLSKKCRRTRCPSSPKHHAQRRGSLVDTPGLTWK